MFSRKQCYQQDPADPIHKTVTMITTAMSINLNSDVTN